MKVWELLKWQAGKYNGIDSTSMPIEKAQDLLASLIYTLSLVAKEDRLSSDVLLQRDFHQVVKREQDILDSKRKAVYQDWKQLCLDAPNICNVYYISTMQNLGLFFKRYDIYYEAHQIPCSIDYLLLNPVEEGIKGISYIEEYIRRIRIENSFISLFDFDIVIGLLQRGVPDYKENYLNLSEPVFINSLGKELLGQDPNTLNIFKSDIPCLMSFFERKTKDELVLLFRNAFESICQKSGFEVDRMQYFFEEINSLAIRVESATKTDCLSNVFIVDNRYSDL